MHNDPSDLIVAVSKALGRKLDRRKFNDRLLMQKGCYILNSWGYGPYYRYGLYIRGPYSSELADDYYEIGRLSNSTTIPSDAISKLSEIMNKGIEYTEAYATVLLVKRNNPGRTDKEIFDKSLNIKPHLEKEVTEACASILN